MQIEITPSATCKHEQTFDYWHDACGLDDCAVDECKDCHAYATQCGIEEGVN